MNYKGYVEGKLKGIPRERIFFTTRAFLQRTHRLMNKEEIIANIINPERLEYAIKEPSKYEGEEKFKCYFGYGELLCHQYVIVLTENVLIVTAMQTPRRWRAEVEKLL